MRGGRAPVMVRIEWDGMERRIRKVTNFPGAVLDVVPSPDSRAYALVAIGGQTAGDAPEEAAAAGPGPGLYIVREDGRRPASEYYGHERDHARRAGAVPAVAGLAASLSGRVMDEHLHAAGPGAFMRFQCRSVAMPRQRLRHRQQASADAVFVVPSHCGSPRPPRAL